MAITIRQIATVAGVSRGTVDRVLHNRSGVKPEIAEHVRKIAAELGFEPNRAGKMLASRKQPLKIGCFLPSIGNAFFGELISGIHHAQTEYSDFGVSILLQEIEGYSVTDHIAAIGRLINDGCTALCVSTIDVPEMCTYINQIISSGIPVITLNTDLSHTARLCYVGCNYLHGGCTAAGLLSLIAHEKLNLLIVTGSMRIKGHNERVQGFSRTLHEKQTPYRMVDIFESLDNDTHAYEKTLQSFRTFPEINCVYITAAGVAGVCRALVELGCEHNTHVLCFDEIPSTIELLNLGVIDFTIGQQPFEQGKNCIRALFEYFMSNKKELPTDYITQTIIKIKENI